MFQLLLCLLIIISIFYKIYSKGLTNMTWKKVWNKYRTEITTQTRNNNIDYLIDTTFRNISRLFVFSFKIDNYDPSRNSFDEYYITLVETKRVNKKTNKQTNKKRMENFPKCQEIMIIQQEIYLDKQIQVTSTN